MKIAKLPDVSTRQVIVYAGPCYGRLHAVIGLHGRVITVRTPEGQTLSFSITDTEAA